MRHAISKQVIVPRIYYDESWQYIAERIRSGDEWYKMWYYSTSYTLEAAVGSTIGNAIIIDLSINLTIMA